MKGVNEMENETIGNNGRKGHIKNRNEFVFLYDIKNGNPNGDPDENRPRIDDATKHCYVTDVRLKRFVRDYIIQTEGEDPVLVAVCRICCNLHGPAIPPFIPYP